MASNAITPYQKLKQMVSSDEIKNRFREILGQKSQGFLASVLNTVYMNDNLRNADPNTIMTSALTAAALDLPVDPNLGFSYIIPYKDKAQFQIGYKGYIQLALRSGQYESINAVEIYEGEEVKVDRLTGKVTLNGKRTGDKVIGYVAYFRLMNGFEKFIYRGVSEIQAHAKRYSKSFDKPSSVWKSDFDKMAKKTVLKEIISKYGIMSIQMQTAIDHDVEPEADEEPSRDLFQPQHEVIEGEMRDVETYNAVAALIDEGICENEFAASGLLNKYVPEEVKVTRAALVRWGKLYRGWRDAGDNAESAAQHATNGEVPGGGGTEQTKLI